MKKQVKKSTKKATSKNAFPAKKAAKKPVAKKVVKQPKPIIVEQPKPEPEPEPVPIVVEPEVSVLDSKACGTLQKGNRIILAWYAKEGGQQHVGAVVVAVQPSKPPTKEKVGTNGELRLETFPANLPKEELVLSLNGRHILGPRETEYSVRWPNSYESESIGRVIEKEKTLIAQEKVSRKRLGKAPREVKVREVGENGEKKERAQKLSADVKITVIKTANPYKGKRAQLFEMVKGSATVGEFRKAMEKAGWGPSLRPILRAVEHGLVKI